MKSSALLLAALIFLQTCAVTRPLGPPDWVTTGKSADYPREEYLVGVGRGRSHAAAEDNARAEIAKIFQARVEQTTHERATYSETESSRAAGSWSRSIDISQATEVETSKVLSGVEIVARYEGPEGYAALAVLSRSEASDRLWRRAKELSDRATALIERAQQARDPLEAARSYYQAARLLGLVETLNQDIAVLAVRRPVKAAMSPGQAWDSFREVIRDHLPFTVAAEGEQAERVKAAVEGALSERGVPLSSAGKRERIVIKCRSEFRPENRPPKEYKFVRFEVTLQALDTQEGTVWAAAGPISDTASGKTYEQAVERAVWLVRSKHIESFITEVFEKLFGAGIEKGSE